MNANIRFMKNLILLALAVFSISTSAFADDSSRKIVEVMGFNAGIASVSYQIKSVSDPILCKESLEAESGSQLIHAVYVKNKLEEDPSLFPIYLSAFRNGVDTQIERMTSGPCAQVFKKK